MIKLEEIIGFLSNLKSKDNVEFVVGESIELKDRNIEKTQYLQELAILNSRREELLKKTLSINYGTIETFRY